MLFNSTTATSCMVIILVFQWIIQPLTAYPNRAGHCKEGPLSNKSGGWHGDEGSGSLSNGNLIVSIGDTQLSPDSTLTIQRGKQYRVQIRAGNPEIRKFRGFLFRLASVDGYDVYDVLTESSFNVQRKTTSLCSTIVAAMTHTNNQLKSFVEFYLEVPVDLDPVNVESMELRLDITVVEEVAGASDDWYYDLFRLIVNENGAIPTASPTGSVIEVPSSEPTKSNHSTDFPTPLPSQMQLSSEAPVSSPPSSSPTSTPSSNLTAEPTKQVPKEGKYTKFALRYNKNNILILRNCNWLQKRPTKLIRKYCSRKKFQLYTRTTSNEEATTNTFYLPASQICFETCAPFCVEERQNSVFVLGKDQSENEELMLRQCKWLAKQQPLRIAEICDMDEEFDTMYGLAYQVCTNTCEASAYACN